MILHEEYDIESQNEIKFLDKLCHLIIGTEINLPSIVLTMFQLIYQSLMNVSHLVLTGIQGIRQWLIRYFISPMMRNKITLMKN